ncbi:MAG TPA: phosphatidate cytidylyltransferase [Candidatus Kapabacteria bacterium]|jgi:phosphatidate cytidylyltransferase|nr:phosphatidate cytidylyltransferase [Candidatus Kapabacteria bacterium]HOV93234.1 phosphatidate cytidylyltransferase [Candidatus Kapabacteria bacterium]
MNELAKRTIVGIIGVPLVLLIIYLGGWYYFIAFAFLFSVGLWEFYRLAKAKGYNPLTVLGIISGLSILFSIYLIFTFSYITHNVGSIFIAMIQQILILFIILFTVSLFRNNGNTIANISTTFGGLVYLLIPFSSLIILRFFYNYLFSLGITNNTNWAFYLFVFFATIWICDSCAYFIGKKWGKHKIAPSISPKKSWEGGIAGLISGILSFWLLGLALKIDLPISILLLDGLIIGTFGQIGDFIESSFKRDANVKDSGKLFWEHGGVLDRFDSIMFSAPVLLLVLIIYFL